MPQLVILVVLHLDDQICHYIAIRNRNGNDYSSPHFIRRVVVDLPTATVAAKPRQVEQKNKSTDPLR